MRQKPLVAGFAGVAEGVDAVAEQPLAAVAVQVDEIGASQDHSVQQLLHLLVGLRLHIANLPRVTGLLG